MSREEWRSIPGYEGRYDVSSRGRVRSLLGRWGTRLLVMHPATDSDGYQVVTLYLNGTRPSRKVHTLVLEAFVGPRPDGMVTRHLDGDPSNNRLSNIAYGTPRENSLDRVRHGRGSKPGKFCRRGHPMVPDKSGWCSTCRTERYHARRKAQKALASSSAS